MYLNIRLYLLLFIEPASYNKLWQSSINFSGGGGLQVRDYAVNAYPQESNDYFKYEVGGSSIKISITPHQQMGDTNTLFANARVTLSRNSIITSRDSCEIESAYTAHMKKHGGALSNLKDNHNIERENHGSSFSF